jgi:hypothetical protein
VRIRVEDAVSRDQAAVVRRRGMRGSDNLPKPQIQQSPHLAGFVVFGLVGRGNLNSLSKIMNYMANICFYFWLEYHLEYPCKIALHVTTRFGEGKAQ